MNTVFPIAAPPAGEPTADQQLRHRIQLFLESLRLPILRRVQIVVQGDTAIIEGIARSYYERQMVLACVRRVAGVRQIIDRVVVHEPIEQGARP